MHDMENSSQQSAAGSQQPFMDDGSATLYQGDCLDVLRRLPSESVHCCVTSPPYFGLRDYGTAEWQGGDAECDHKVGRNTRGGMSEKQASSGGSFGDEAIRIGHACPHCGAVRIDEQIGLEATPAEFVAKMVAVFTEVHRVLRKDGTLWLNLGDSYWGSGKGLNPDGTHSSENKPTDKQFTNKGALKTKVGKYPDDLGLKPKDLMGMPWRVAFALQEAGWWLRQDIIWSKPNPMPESVTDRCTKAHEYIFLLSKSAKYFYDAEAIKEPNSSSNNPRFLGTRGNLQTTGARNGDRDFSGGFPYDDAGRNKRSVWTVTTQPYSEAHFATFPPKLIEPCVLAGCPSDGVVLDPFAGAGTTLLVAKRLGRKSVGIELNPEYCKLIERRLEHWHKPSPPKAVDESFVGTLFEGIDQEVAA